MQCLGFRIQSLVVLGFTALLALPLPAHAQSRNRAQILVHFRKGMNAYARGDYDIASDEFQKMLNLNPDSDLILELREKAGIQKLVQMMFHSKLEKPARMWLEMAEKAAGRRQADLSKVKDLIRSLEKGFEPRWQAIHGLVAAGQAAVPFLVNCLSEAYLNSRAKTWIGKDWTDQKRVAEKQEIKSAAKIAIKRIGRDAVYPLIHALRSWEPEVKHDVIWLLKLQNDVRAAPALKALSRDKRQPPEVRDSALTAYEAILGPRATDAPPEHDYLKLAEDYYYEKPEVMPYFFDEQVPLWKWVPPKRRPSVPAYERMIVQERIPRYAFNERMAEQACYEALRLNGGLEPAMSLLVSVYFQQVNEVNALLAAHRKGGPNRLSAPLLKATQALKAKLAATPFLVRPIGKRVLYGAMRRALRDRDSEALIQCITNLRADADRSREVGEGPLVDALGFPDKHVRYLAAECLLHIAPNGELGGVKRTVNVVSHALSEVTQRAVLIIDDSTQNRNRLRAELQALNYIPVEAATKMDGLNKARQGYPPPDVILLASTLANANIRDVVLTLRRDARSSTIPIVLVTDGKAPDALTRKHVQALLPARANRKAIAQALQSALRTHDSDFISKAEAQKIIRLHVEALQQIDPKSTRYPLARLIPGLIPLLKNQPDNIRTPAVRILSALGDRQAMPPLIQIFTQPKIQKPLRLAALEAIGSIVMASRKITDDEFLLLKKSLLSKNPQIRALAATTLGKAPLSNEQIVLLLRQQRINR